MRTLASFLAEADPDIAALSEIDAGDALAIATRFDRAWAYRGGQALLWKARFAARDVHDLYLPISPLRAFDRRGLLRVDGRCDGAELSLFATQFATDRVRVRELRFARSVVRGVGHAAVLFLSQQHGRIGFSDLGFHAAGTCDDLEIAVRGFRTERSSSGVAGGGIGSSVTIRATPAG
jgi:hypothetical protein